MNSTCNCGCCEGIEIAVPQNTTNRPGLPALAYRVGTHATFLETMIARLSSQEYPALAALKTRDPADFSIALLDSWSVVADVLTFYQERLANEGYLRTATERRSILELARLIGYKLRPGVSATVYLAYTLDEDRSKTPPAPTKTLIPTGSRSQSVPGPGQLPQSFETAIDLDARSEWNDLGVRLTQPQNLTSDGADLNADITTRETVYFNNTSTNLQPGDPLMFVLGKAVGQQGLRLVQSVEVQSAQKRTEVILQSPAGATLAAGKVLSPVTSEILGKVSFAPLARLTALLPALALPPSLQPPNALRLDRSVGGAFSSNSDMAPRLLGAFSPLAAPLLYQAWANIDRPADSALVGAVRVKAGLFPGTYPGVPTVIPPPTPSIQITRRRTAAASGQTSGSQTVFDNPPTIGNDWQGLVISDKTKNTYSLAKIALDTVYEKILAGGWVMIDRPDLDPAKQRIQTFHKVISTATTAMTTKDSGFSAKVTQLTIDPPWFNGINSDAWGILSHKTPFLSNVVVYTQVEMLELAEEPLDTDIAGDTIELGLTYDGLESGRWIIMSGERTDIPNVTGVIASELVMILGVAQVTTSPNGQIATVHTKLTLANKLAYTYDIDTVTIYGNVVKATHGETRNEVLGNGDGSQAFQQFALKQKPLTFVPASNPTGTDSTLEIYVNNVEWQEADTLAGLGAKDRDFITQTADDDTTAVTFGNGRQGARLPTGVGNVSAVYRNGIGQPGNVDANQISLLQTRPLNVKAVINPLRASGGADRDSRDQARRNAPLAVMALDRLVSVQDYADFARTFAGIGKASSARLSDGQRDLVHVTVAGAEDIPIDYTSDLYANLVQALQVNGDPYLPIVVAVRRLKLLVISANVKILPDYLWEPVATAIRTALITTFSFDNRELGQPVFASEVISVIQAVAGVAYVDLDKFDSVAEGLTADQLAGLANSLILRDYITTSLAVPNPKPVSPPDDNLLAVELAYLTPAIPDTLILNQVKP